MTRSLREIDAKAGFPARVVRVHRARVRMEPPTVEQLFWLADRLLAKAVPWLVAAGLSYFAAHVLVAALR